MIEKNISSMAYDIETIIDASPKRVWHALSNETNAWWLPDFHMVAPDSVVELQLRPGGHLIEHHRDGGGLLWYTVQMCNPEKSLDLIGHLSPEFGGPAISMMSWKLSAVADKCRLQVHDTLLGCVRESGVREAEKGWSLLIGDGLRAYVESKKN